MPGRLTRRHGPGLYPWPVWGPAARRWLPPGSWQLGLATGLAGVLAGMVMLRAVRFLFGLGRGKEGLGVGDADLMMMAGSLPRLAAGGRRLLRRASSPALFFGIVQLICRGDQALPFGPSLAAGRGADAAGLADGSAEVRPSSSVDPTR